MPDASTSLVSSRPNNEQFSAGVGVFDRLSNSGVPVNVDLFLILGVPEALLGVK
jgi:hypothetical protein